MHIVLRFVLEPAAVDWAAAQSHHLLHRHLQTYSGTNQLSEHLLLRLAGWCWPSYLRLLHPTCIVRRPAHHRRGPSLTETVKMCQSMCPSLNEAGEFNYLNEYACLRGSVCVYVRGTEKE